MAFHTAVRLGRTTHPRKYSRGDGTATSAISKVTVFQTPNKIAQTSSLTSKATSKLTAKSAAQTQSHTSKHNKHDHNFDAASPGDSTSSSTPAAPTQSAGGSSKSNSSDGNSGSNSNGSNGKDNNPDPTQTHGNSDSSTNKNNGGDDSDSDSDGDDSNSGNSGNNSANSGGGFPKFSGTKNFGPCEFVNENDGRLRYTGTWVLESKDPDGNFATTHTTSTAGSAVTISFNGTSITIIGIVHASNDTMPPAVASYTIDGDTPVSLPLPFSNRDIPNQQFFESPNLELSAHKLVINITSDNSPYTLDTLEICSQGDGAVATVLTPSSSVKALHKNTATIIGAAVGGAVAFILFLVLGIVLLHRLRRRNRSRRTASSPIKSWLQHTIFTSSESIMRHNPSNISSLDPYEKLPEAEKAPVEAEEGPATPSIYRDSKILPPAPEIFVKPDPSAVEDERRNIHRLSDRSSVLQAPFVLRSVSVSDRPELPLSALPEAYHSLPPHPPLYTQQPSR